MDTLAIESETIIIGQEEVDNRWIVLYNTWLLKKFDAHTKKCINVEICSSVKPIRYIFKYVYRGHNCASLELRVTN